MLYLGSQNALFQRHLRRFHFNKTPQSSGEAHYRTPFALSCCPKSQPMHERKVTAALLSAPNITWLSSNTLSKQGHQFRGIIVVSFLLRGSWTIKKNGASFQPASHIAPGQHKSICADRNKGTNGSWDRLYMSQLRLYLSTITAEGWIAPGYHTPIREKSCKCIVCGINLLDLL